MQGGESVYMPSGCAISAEVETFLTPGTSSPNYISFSDLFGGLLGDLSEGEVTMDYDIEIGACTNDNCNSARREANSGISCTVTRFEELDDEGACAEVIATGVMTYECAQYAASAGTRSVDCGHTADVCTAIKFSKVRTEEQEETPTNPSPKRCVHGSLRVCLLCA